MISGVHQGKLSGIWGKFSGMVRAAVPQDFVKASLRMHIPTQLGAMYFDFLRKHDKELPCSYMTSSYC